MLIGAATYALLEVMDKEASVPGLWTWGIFLGIGGFLVCRRWPWVAVLILPLAFVAAWAVHAEIVDPFVGPAIRDEAGNLYPLHAYLSAALSIVGPLVGVLRRRRSTPRAA